MNDLLTKDHRELDQLLVELFRALERQDEPEIFKTLDIFWARLAMHIRAEHLHLFPAILKNVEQNTASDLESVTASINELRSDHDFFVRELAAAVKMMRELIFFKQIRAEKLPLVIETVNAVVEMLKKHNEIEESEIYNLAENIIDEAEHAELNNLIEKELSKLPPRFDGDRSGRSNLGITTLLQGYP